MERGAEDHGGGDHIKPGRTSPIPDLQGRSSTPFPCASTLLRPPVQCSSKEPSSQRQKPSWAESSDPTAPSLRDPHPDGSRPALSSTAAGTCCAHCVKLSPHLCVIKSLHPGGQGFTIPVSPGYLDHRTVGLTDLDEDDICSGIFKAQQRGWVPRPQPAPNLSRWNSSLTLSGCLSHCFRGSQPRGPQGKDGRYLLW